ncbi:MAG TPA: Rrf2 family transcriptional regulator [Phycisphaerae bacterium]|nr:Rrf2 family transcriptional regulator [Phycisphaerae bacterium]
MIFSNPAEYAIRALSELVLMSQDTPAGTRRIGYVMLDKLTEQASLPREFLAKIFRQLVEGGILVSAKGPGGGFALARPAHDVSLLQVIEAIDGGHQIDGCVVGLAKCNDHMPCPQHDLFKPIRQRLRAYLQTTTLADTAASLKEKKAIAAQDTVIPEVANEKGK